MNISAWAIRKPVPAILLFVVLTLMGLIGLKQLGIQNFPDMDFPTVTVSASLEGAAPAQLETEVARKIEDQLASLGGVEHITTTITDGAVNISVQFELEKDSEEALNQVRNAVDSVRGQLPAEMEAPTVSKVTTSGNPILTYTVQSSRMDEEALSWFVDNEVSKALLSTKGVGKLARLGGVDREVLVALDPAKLSGLGISTATVAGQLKAVQQDASGGEGRLGGQTQSLRTLGAVGSVAEIAALPIPLGDGRHVRLDSLATVSDSHAERTSFALLDGKPVIGFQITKVKGSSEVAVAEAVRASVASLQQRYPLVQFSEAYNTVAPIEDNYQGSMHLLLEGAILAVLVVFWFLRDWRATLVSATALPLSIIPTFAAMYFLDFSLNVLTLLSLALVIGILVDDAIVEVENIVRHLRMGKSPIQAAMEAADEIGLAVVATTLTLVAVFLPTAFMGGIPGKFFRQFGMTAAVAVLASLLVARLLTPMMAAYLLKPSQHAEQDSALMVRYLRWVNWCMRHRKATMTAAALFFVASLSLVPLLPTGFVPASDQSQTQVSLELAPGSRLEDTRKLAEQARQLLAPLKDVKQVFASVGTASSGSGMGASTSSDVRSATLTLNLTPRSERSYKQADIEARIRAALQPLAGARVTVGGGNTGESLQLTLASDDADALESASKSVERELRQLKGIGSISSGASLQRPEIQIKPDYARAADLGVTSSALANAVRVATYGDFSASLGKLNLPQRQIDVRVRLDTQTREDLDALGQLRIAGAQGEVSLASVAEISMGSGPSQIDRRDRLRQATIKVELGGRSMGEVMQEANALPALKSLPAGVKQLATGDAERMAELFGSFGLAMLIGILCIYIVLVLLFHDFLQPATILAALPLSVGGAFLALLITGNSFSMPPIIGLLMLMGVVTKNSILLVEYAVMARREQGMNRWDALLDACHKRARPILMTTIAMAAGMLPIAMGLGADPSFRAPMAIAVIGGLLTSTLLSLLVIPVVFTYVDDLLIWLGQRFKRPAKPVVAATSSPT
ncbi:efflux RND transporter permease subunit [Chitinimonas taiwanensis]|uniref:Hydrophobe/amphiphile efflux-1 (HAE1) family protein n=1 Tax=Chitinimonas taiwanensis DSM 18899 TaxID=1121279 RepID=A0A1K2HAD4_9NEIS|nr:efflux RND transporter permease subunit [Chitinimonas taiwanensis]SFZ73743.1 hydrophobe/amphiphile efflux-1 (HAE1) family protein [Chitinimonas taiwanensis DSM 18899]